MRSFRKLTTHLYVSYTKDGTGWSYEVIDREGHTIAIGWSRGTRSDARDTALEDVAEKGY